ncbi:unnamed protein product [Medioppia subpectinata]|uniref:Uncharacterized protein n=1 Tax=Medioppia subpectinata TaxID=1979941 RepID=A0A7R9PUH2_9ACAR|nr:unnamed protein product [Medioppia subpectinata]CAG2101763.1 unnamed protein product [Medioppia subpectinata]
MGRAIPIFVNSDSRETDMVFVDTPITQTIASFTGLTPRIRLEPMITILSSVYPIIQNDSFGSSCLYYQNKSGTKSEIDLLKRGLNNTPEDILSNAPNLFSQKKTLRVQIVFNKTHVFIASQTHVKMIENAISLTTTKVTHISQEKYLEYFVGFVYSKYLDPFVAQKYDDIVYSALETGIYQKWADDIVEVASHIYGSNEEPIVITESDNKFVIKLWDRVVSGFPVDNPCLALFAGIQIEVRVNECRVVSRLNKCNGFSIDGSRYI